MDQTVVSLRRHVEAQLSCEPGMDQLVGKPGSVTSVQEIGKAATRRVQELHVRPALVDASMVRSRRADACQGREHRQV